MKGCNLRWASALLSALAAAASAQAPASAPPPAAAEKAAPADAAAAPQRDPFEVTPQMRMGSARAGTPGAFVQMLRNGEGLLPPMKLKALLDGPEGRIALVEVQGIGLFRVREGENIQLSPSLAVKVKRIGRDQLVVNPQDLGDAPNTLVIR